MVIEEAFYSGEEPTEPCFRYASEPEATPIGGTTIGPPSFPMPQAPVEDRSPMPPKTPYPPAEERQRPWWRLF